MADIYGMLDELQHRAAKEEDIKEKLLATRKEEEPFSAFCRVCRELGENENFIADLIDMEVVTDEGKVLGTLTDVIETGANDVYAVKTPEGKEILLPAIRDCILDVNVDEKRMTVHVMEGLLD